MTFTGDLDSVESLSSLLALGVRALPTAKAMVYLGVKRRAFEVHVRPRLTPIPIGTSLLFDVRDLDRAFDELKAQRINAADRTAAAHPAQNALRNGRPDDMKGVEQWADQCGASTPMKAVPGRSTKSGAALDFASAVSQVLAKRRPG